MKGEGRFSARCSKNTQEIQSEAMFLGEVTRIFQGLKKMCFSVCDITILATCISTTSFSNKNIYIYICIDINMYI